MSTDRVDSTEKKVKSKTKDKSRKVELVEKVDQERTEHVDVERKKRKKDKKKRTDSKQEQSAPEDEPNGDVPTEDTTGNDAMTLDAETPPPKVKKEKRKTMQTSSGSQSLSTPAELETAMIVDEETQGPLLEKEKKKKRKHTEEIAESSGGAAAQGESRTKADKKKRRKTDDASGQLEGEGRKEKKRRQRDNAGVSPTSEPDIITSHSEPTPSIHSQPAQSETTAFLAKHSITMTTPDDVPAPTPVLAFEQLADLGVPQEITEQAFKGFKEPTPIQACTWPPALEGKDVVGIAETGSGKTLAFGIPALCRLIKTTSSEAQNPISTLVVAPTRELALQTHDTLSVLGKPFGIASVAVFGGVPKEPQIKMLRNVAGKSGKGKDGLTTRIVVGTPGRILDLMQEGVCDLSGVNYLVLDEADRMLDKGFENDIRTIIAATRPSEGRQTMMFSATWPEAVRRLASTFQRAPVRVTVGSDDLTANSRVEQSVEVFDDARSKDQRLLNVLRSFAHKKKATSPDESRILVFALYKKEASRVEQMLRRQGYSVGALHGDMSQTARMEALDNFKTGKTGLLVATDVAARGLDIPNVGVVVNYTFPLTIEDYIHRIGRTGRGGKHGKSVTFFTGDAHEKSLAGEFARVLKDGGFDTDALKKFPLTIKKREHSAYGAFYRDDIPVPKGPTKIVF